MANFKFTMNFILPLLVTNLYASPIDKKYALNTENLSRYWAQEYTGADLVREILINRNNIFQFENLFGLLDTSFEGSKHGEYVSNIIAGPHPSATIPEENPIDFYEVIKLPHSHPDYQKLYHIGFEEYVTDCTANNNCPMILNVSMSWDSQNTVNAFRKLGFHKTVVVTSAGNHSYPVMSGQRENARQDEAILISNIGYDGNPHESTSYAPEITIGAPSGYEITSFDFSDNIEAFGGTSGAAPMVTSALIAFSKITGYHLTTEEAKKLLIKTALKLPNYPIPNNTGHGILNTYKIGKLALRLDKKCMGRADSSFCMTYELNNEDNYKFAFNHQVIEEAKIVFPGCWDRSIPVLNYTSDPKAKKVFDKLRAEALLNDNVEELWRTLSCISNAASFTKNSSFYKSLSNNHLNNDYFKKNPRLFMRHILAFNNDVNKYSRLVEEFLKRNDSEIDWDIVMLVLTNPSFKDWKKWAEILIDKTTEEKNYFYNAFINYTLEKPHWIKTPDLLKKIILKCPKNYYYRLSLIVRKHYDQYFQQYSSIEIGNDYIDAIKKGLEQNP